MVDTTQALPSVNEPVVDRFRKWNPVWYRWIKPLLENLRETMRTVDAQAITITETNEVVTEVQGDLASVRAQWGVSINGNGQLIGLVKLDSVDAYSTFTVVADKFLIAHPTASGTTIEAFILGLVNGVSTVGINGDLIVDGTIVARHIAVTELSALTANIGTCTAGVIRSADNKMIIDLDNKSITIDT